MANLLGINTNTIIALTFVVGAALAAVALAAFWVTFPRDNPASDQGQDANPASE